MSMATNWLHTPSDFVHWHVLRTLYSRIYRHNSSNTVIGSAAGFSATNSSAGEVLVGNETYYTTTTVAAYNTALGYRLGAGYSYQSASANNTLIGAFSDFSGANAFTSSTAIGYNSRIARSSQVVLGTSTENTVIPSTKVY